jgi:hypothetical protein
MPAKDRRTAHQILEAFVQKARTVRNDVLVGIDPGTGGAIGFKCEKFYCVVDIPMLVTKREKRRKTTKKDRLKLVKTGKPAAKWKVIVGEDRHPNYAGIIALFKLLKPVKDRVHVLLEKVPLTIGKGRAYGDMVLNRLYGMWPLFLTSKNYAGFHEEAPLDWKEALGIPRFKGVPPKKARVLKKKASLALARKLYPGADIAREMDHDRAEALLMVEFLRRKLEKRKK